MGKKIKKMRNNVFLLCKLTESTEVTRHLGRVTRVFLVYCRVWYCIVSYIGLVTVKLEADTNRSSHTGIDRFFERCCKRKLPSDGCHSIVIQGSIVILFEIIILEN